jgi:small redox-active disulfide protein 2
MNITLKAIANSAFSNHNKTALSSDEEYIMSEENVKQVMINGRLIGIAGVEDAINKISLTAQGKSDEEICNGLLELVSSTNFIPSGARNNYGKALLREYQKSQNLPFADEPSQGFSIAVLGMSCTRCNQLESDVRDLLSELKIAADLRHVTDMKEIAHYGVLGSPALVINNKVVSVGEVPPKSKIRQWIIDAYSSPE